MKFITYKYFFILSLFALCSSNLFAKMVYVEGGSFYMQDWRKQKCHKVTVSDFEIDSVETGMRYNWWQSVAECNRMSREQGYTPCYSLHGETDERKWGTPPESCEFDIMEVWANIECDFNANGYRLPTTAEWEWAARGRKATCPKKESHGMKPWNSATC